MVVDEELAGVLEPLVGAPVWLEELKHKPGRRRTLRAVGGRRSAIVKLYASEGAATVLARPRAERAAPAHERARARRRLALSHRVRRDLYEDQLMVGERIGLLRLAGIHQEPLLLELAAA